MKVEPLPPDFNPDIECLRCGARNIPDNRICGACGASLPLVFDENGRPRIVTDDVRRFGTITGKTRGKGFFSGSTVRGEGVRWGMRFLVIFGALAAAIWILSRR